MSLPPDLQRLPPEALDVIRCLSNQEQGAEVDTIRETTGLSERGFRKAIRRIVTLKYAQMPDRDFYVLTDKGREAVQALLAHDGALPAAGPSPVEPPPAAVPVPVEPPPDAPVEPALAEMDAGIAPETAARPAAIHERALSVLVAQALVLRETAMMMVGFDAATDQSPLSKPGRVILRVSAPGCDVEPTEHPLNVIGNQPAGPVRFRITPRCAGTVRVRIEVYQYVIANNLVPVGGMFFNTPVTDLPTLQSAQFRTLGAAVRLYG